jgi:serine/threonine-protein kinase
MAAVQPETKIGIGTLLAGKYKVTRELGRGGMAAVYEAENVSIGKKLAVKVLASELANSAIVIERFFREARAAASVKSPYIVEVYDSGRLEDGRPFIAMELLEGESLYDRMARVRLIDPQSTVRIIGQVAKGLVKAHAANIVHRDLKPENIHLCKGEDGEEIAKVLDFGLAKFYSPMKPDEKTNRLTREGAVFGTPAYMSPEQVKGQGNVDHRADLWALGCMTFECLTGRPVWNTDQGVAMTFAAIAAAQLPIPSRLRSDLPPAFDAWFRKALERDPNKRFQGAKELADELARALGAPPISLVNIGSPSQIEMEALAHAEAIAGLEETMRSDPLGSDPEAPRPASARNAFSGVKPKTPGVALPAGSARRLSSEPIDLLASRNPALSATDLPPTASPEPPPASFRRGRSSWRVAATLLAVAGAAAGGWFLYRKVFRARLAGTQATASAASAVTGAPSASDPSLGYPPPAPLELPKWMTTLEDGQQALSSGDVEGALRKFKEASDEGGGPVAKSFLEQVKLAAASPGPCKLAAFSHPRFGYGGSLGRPAVAVTSRGAIVAWTDDHEQSGHDHVYSVLIDPAGRPTSRPRDLTPETDYAMRPELLTVDDRVALLFWDKNAKEPGVRVRWLEADGRIGGMSSTVATGKPGTLFWPTMDRAPDGTFWVAWQQNPDKEGDDLFLRHIDSDLKPLGNEIRATDYQGEKGKSPRAISSSIAVSNANLFLAYTLEREKQHLIERMRIGLTPDLTTGLTGTSKTSRELGETAVVNEEKMGGEYPDISCTRDACFLVWHETEKGAAAALVDPVKGTLLWRKRFAPKGAHPAVASMADGQAEVAFYEAGRVRVAAVSRDGFGATTTFARVTGDAPRPWIVAGRAHGEWLVSWLDVEAGHTEAFVARLQCRN